MTDLQRFRRLDARLRKLETEHATALRQLQKTCKHANKVECNYQVASWCSLQPMRVCKDCGLFEEGWGCGYQKLRHPNEYGDSCREDIPLVSRDTVIKYMRVVGEG